MVKVYVDKSSLVVLTTEVPNTALLKRVAIRFGFLHGLRPTNIDNLVRYYNALA